MVLMIRGLHSSWKQPVGYFFVATTYTGYDLQNTIFQCIKKLGEISFIVKLMIYDLGCNFERFIYEQGITLQTPYFNIGEREKFTLQIFIILIKLNNIDWHLN